MALSWDGLGGAAPSTSILLPVPHRSARPQKRGHLEASDLPPPTPDYDKSLCLNTSRRRVGTRSIANHSVAVYVGSYIRKLTSPRIGLTTLITNEKLRLDTPTAAAI